MTKSQLLNKIPDNFTISKNFHGDIVTELFKDVEKHNQEEIYQIRLDSDLYIFREMLLDSFEQPCLHINASHTRKLVYYIVNGIRKMPGLSDIMIFSLLNQRVGKFLQTLMDENGDFNDFISQTYDRVMDPERSYKTLQVTFGRQLVDKYDDQNRNRAILDELSKLLGPDFEIDHYR